MFVIPVCPELNKVSKPVMNQIFGYQIIPEEKHSNNIRFDGTHPVEVSADVNRKDRQVNLFAGPTPLCRVAFQIIMGRIVIFGASLHIL